MRSTEPQSAFRSLISSLPSIARSIPFVVLPALTPRDEGDRWNAAAAGC
ncbi:hypothetical protein ACFPRL_02425 [Pseudoclavibacter helvolus]